MITFGILATLSFAGLIWYHLAKVNRLTQIAADKPMSALEDLTEFDKKIEQFKEKVESPGLVVTTPNVTFRTQNDIDKEILELYCKTYTLAVQNKIAYMMHVTIPLNGVYYLSFADIRSQSPVELKHLYGPFKLSEIETNINKVRYTTAIETHKGNKTNNYEGSVNRLKAMKEQCDYYSFLLSKFNINLTISSHSQEERYHWWYWCGYTILVPNIIKEFSGFGNFTDWVSPRNFIFDFIQLSVNRYRQLEEIAKAKSNPTITLAELKTAVIQSQEERAKTKIQTTSKTTKLDLGKVKLTEAQAS
jgi:hypothetical protein